MVRRVGDRSAGRIGLGDAGRPAPHPRPRRCADDAPGAGRLRGRGGCARARTGAAHLDPSPPRRRAVSAVASFEGVSKRYGRAPALASTTFHLDRGVVGLLGPNGAGKTTMLRLLSTALPPSTGRIVVAGFDVTASHADRV